MPTILTTTQLAGPKHQGKVRDIYDLGQVLLLVATDRISAFDVVLPNGIPERGVVLTELSRFWFERSADLLPNHLIAMGLDAEKVSAYIPDLPHEMARRAMLVKKAEPVMVECVVRGYLAGSAWAEYRKSGTINGASAPAGLQECERLDSPLFTPTTKARVGHDEAITLEQMKEMVGAGMTGDLERLSLELYGFAHEYALTRGIIIADTKFEFGLIGDAITLIDEVLTPDSSRFWDASHYQAGRSQDSFDKQVVRDWLSSTDWNKEPPAPELPSEVVENTVRRYKEVYQRLTGEPLP